MEENLIDQEIKRRESKSLPAKIRERLEKFREARREKREQAINKLEALNDKLQKDAQQVQKIQGLKKDIRTARRAANPFAARMSDKVTKAAREKSGVAYRHFIHPRRRGSPLGKRNKLQVVLGGGSATKFFGSGKGGMRKWI
jgi:hypothetical protein